MRSAGNLLATTRKDQPEVLAGESGGRPTRISGGGLSSLPGQKTQLPPRATTGSVLKSDGRRARSVEMMTQRPTTGPFRSSGITSPHPHTPPSQRNTKYYWRVRAFNAVRGTLGWSLVWTFRTALLPPVLSAPVDTFASKELRPLFDWSDVPTATGYTVQIAKDILFKQVVHTGSPVGSFYVPTADLPKNTT